jgi:cytochrome P450
MNSPIDAVTHPDPYPWYSALVADRPFYFDDGLGCWVASGAAEVAAVLAEPAGRVRPVAEPVPKGIVGTAAGDVFGSLVRMTDGDLHDRLKAVVTEALSTVEAGAVSDLAAERVRKHLGDGGAADLEALMFAVPCEVVAILCGLDDGAAEEATRLAGEFVQCLPASATPDQQAAAARAAGALRDLMGRHLDGDTLLGELLRAAGRTGWQETAPLLANGIGFLSQTYDATAGLIGNTLVALRRGETLDDVPSFVQEVARHDSPVHTTRRFAAADFEVAGQRVQAGESILLLLAAANRDPSANPDPAVFDTRREAPVRFTFGAAGHGCPGETLAVAIAAGVVGELLADGFDAASLPAEVAYRPSANVRVPIFATTTEGQA